MKKDDSRFTIHDSRIDDSHLTTHDISISVRNLSKKYRLFNSPEERFKEALHPFKKKYHKEFWALKDINFDVPKGATVGIIGRNGSGKSTLLQIICGVLKPTSGTVTVNSRISALLELGAGFNPELTGRQNAMLNGIINGVSKDEMKERVRLIEEFADIGEFFDQPVKIYSSGMFVRLAFAAAINVDPDILIVDEALAVGDAKFQNKCYNKFLEFQKEGKAIIFVTHDMHAIAKHCDYAVLLEKGAIIETGKPNDVVNRYLKIILMDDSSDDAKVVVDPSVSLEAPTPSSEKCITTELDRFLEEVSTTDRCIYRNSYNKNEYRFGDRHAEILDYLLICENKIDPLEIKTWDKIEIYMKVIFHEPVQLPLYGFAIKTIDGVQVYGSNTWLDNLYIPPSGKGEIVIFRYSIKISLAGGDFFITLAIAEKVDGQCILFDHRTDLINLKVQHGKEGFNGFVEMETESKIFLQIAKDNGRHLQ